VHGVENFEISHALDECDKKTAFEPFHLEQERREGYFDDDGNYVRNENESDDERDAWLDDVNVDAELSTAGDKKSVKRMTSDYVQEELSDLEMANMKEELCTYLEAGETVLSALRRLGGTSARRGKGSKSETSKVSRNQTTLSSMRPDEKFVFDKITELSSALMSHGEYDVYNARKESFERASKTSLLDVGVAADGSASGAKPSVPVGYVFDERTGLYKSDASGLLYCPENGGFTNGEGKWWWFDEATRRFVEWT